MKYHVKMPICNMYKCFIEEVNVNVWACKQQSNGVDCGVHRVANVFYLQSGVNISTKRTCKNHIRPDLLTYLKSGHSNELASRKPD